MIRITREACFSFRSYEIFIDGVYRGKIKRNETKEFTTGNGWHTVRAEIDGCGSKDLRVNIKNSIVDLEVGTNVKGWEATHAIEYATIRKDEYLFLRKKKTASGEAEERETENDIEDLEEDSLTNANSFEGSQEAKDVKGLLERMQKMMRNLVVVMIALAAINVFVGTAASFFPEFLDEFLFLVFSSVPLFFGLLYLVLSIGLQQRSRVCAIVAVIVYFADSVLFFMSGLGDVNTIMVGIRAVFALMLLGSLTVIFRYQMLKKKYEATTNNEISVLMQENKPKLNKAQIIICAIIGIIGISALIYWNILGV